MPNNRYAAPLLALIAPLLLYGGALVSQYGFGLHPCEMCYWQRWPHQVAMVLAALALLLRRSDAAMRALTLLSAVAIAVSGAIGVFHAGVEYGLWEGLTTCSTAATGPMARRTSGTTSSGTPRPSGRSTSSAAAPAATAAAA